MAIVIESGDYMTNPSDKAVSVALAELQELLKDYPVEHVEFDEHGRYDADKYPEFHDWVINGWYKQGFYYISGNLFLWPSN